MFIKNLSSQIIAGFTTPDLLVTLEITGKPEEFQHIRGLLGKDINCSELFNDEIHWLRENKEKLEYIMSNMDLTTNEKEYLERLTMEVR